MLNSKQRAYLRSLANTMKPITQIGKDGVNERFLEQLDNMLDSRELVKVNILETAGLDAKETANAICNALRAEYVQAIGFKFTIYRKNLEEPKILFPGQVAKKKAILFYELEKELIEDELLFINNINMKISEVLGNTYDLLFSFNPVNDNNKKLKISLITK